MSETARATARRQDGAKSPPLYFAVETALRDRIRTGEFRPGDPLPTEEALGQAYGVSRITVRRALEALTAQGLILRRRGVGSFIAETRQPGVRSVRLTGSLDEFLATAGALHLEVRGLQTIAATAPVAADLGVDIGDPVTWLELISSLEDGPVIHLDIFFPDAVGREIGVADITAGVPVARTVERVTGLRIVTARQVIQPALADARSARALGIAADTPVLRLRRIYFTANRQAIELAVLTLHPDRYAYEIEFTANCAP